MNTMTKNHQRYINACRAAGLTAESMHFDIEESIFEVMEANGFGFGRGYTADDMERDAAWDEAYEIAKAIRDLL